MKKTNQTRSRLSTVLHWIVAGGALSVVAIVATTSYAYVAGGKVWPGNRASFVFNPNFPDATAGDADAQHAALVLAMNEWNNRANLVFSDAGRTGSTTISNNATNVVHHRLNSSSGNALAVTNLFFSGPTFLDTDIRFFDRLGGGGNIVWALEPNNSQFDLRHVAAHEFGHACGLGHSAQGNAIMFSSSPRGNLNDHLTFDDMLGLTRRTLHPTITVTGVIPSSLNARQTGQRITVMGSGFVSGATEVFFRRRNTNPERLNQLLNVNVESPTQLTAEAPPLPISSPWDVAVRISGDQTRDRLNQVGFVAPPPPTILSVVPSSGPEVGGGVVTIQGTDFTTITNASVRFGTQAATIQQVNSPTELLVIVPPGGLLGRVDVEVMALGGTALATSAYEYQGNPPNLVEAARSPSQATVGGNMIFELQGKPGRNCALMADGQLGSGVKNGLTTGLGCTGNFRLIHNSFNPGSDPTLDGIGRREVILRIPNRGNLAFQTFHIQGVMVEPGIGAVTTNTLTYTIFP